MAKQWKQSLTSSDVQAEAEDALEKDINNLSPDSNSIADNLDGGVAAVDWSSKTPKIADVSSNTTTDVSGSGYVIGVSDVNEAGHTLDIDGTQVYYFLFGNISLFHRFDNSFSLTDEGGSDIGVSYVLD